MKIQFIFSNQYEEVIGNKPVTSEKGSKAVEVISHAWKKHGKKIEKTLFRVTGLHFKEDVRCYLNSRASFSDPLSLKISDSATMLDNLTHELIHVLLTQNYAQIKRGVISFHAHFGSYAFTTRIHILVHAIHWEVAKVIFPARMKAIKDYSVSKAYRDSWKLVERLGPTEIIGLAGLQQKK